MFGFLKTTFYFTKENASVSQIITQQQLQRNLKCNKFVKQNNGNFLLLFNFVSQFVGILLIFYSSFSFSATNSLMEITVACLKKM